MNQRSNPVLEGVLADLTAEGDALEALVAGLDEAGWRTATPAEGWDIATTIAHLAWTDEAAIIAGTDKEAWDEGVLRAFEDPEGFVDTAAAEGAAQPGADILTWWKNGRPALATMLREYPEGQKLPWFGPPMSPASMATARFMETWAHALDIHEAVEVTYQPTDRIRHVAHLGVRTRNFSFGVHELAAPTEEFRIDLVAPSGEVWSYGPEDAAQTLTGSAYHFCLLVTQRANRRDLDLVANGADVDRWLDIAQAFAGPSGKGR
ncbi:MAG: TIGR03084 family metal-binding protein [Propionibacteriales bacterium]|nr:TIGR03084 family metal-binding protein [Propionibacteriales bacterium]